MKIAIASLACAALAATALVGAPASAAPKQILSLTGKFTQLQVVVPGDAKGIGAMGVSTASVKGVRSSRAATMVTRVIAPGSKSDSEIRDTQIQVQFTKGTVIAQGVTEDPKGKLMKTPHVLSVVGGTGTYAGALGTLTVIPPRRSGSMTLLFDFDVQRSLPRESLTFEAPTSVIEGTGNGSVTVTRAVQDVRSYVSITTRLGASQSTDVQLVNGTSTIVARAMTKAGVAARTFSVLGGSGSYEGAQGELLLSTNGRGVTLRVLLPRGKRTTLSWGDSPTSTVNVGSAAFSRGASSKGTGIRNKGSYYSSSIAYPAIDGITPVMHTYTQYFRTGVLVLSGMDLGVTPLTLAMIGGTGGFVAARGSVVLDTSKPPAVRMSGTLRR